MAGLDDRLERIEQHVGGPPPPPEDWPLEDQAEALIAALLVHTLGGTVYSATRREIALLDALIADDLVPENAGELVTPMDAAEQYEREAWLRRSWREHKAMRELDLQRLEWRKANGWTRPTPPHLLPGSEARAESWS